MSSDKIIDFDNELSQIEADLVGVSKEAKETSEHIDETECEIQEIISELEEVPGFLRVVDADSEPSEGISELEDTLERVLELKYKEKLNLSATDIMVSIIAGVVASVIDIVFVGTPEVVKIYRGGEKFDGSILTGKLREIGNGDDTFSTILFWLSDKCKVPYDISVKKDVVNQTMVSVPVTAEAN